MKNSIINVLTVIDYIENNLSEKLNLESISNAVHYSKYHLHRVFINILNMSIHDYVLRRRLTEAAKLLAFSNKTIIEISLIAGYESQQAFTKIFKAMYKKTPNQYRKEEEFYPLQLRYNLNNKQSRSITEINWKSDIVYASKKDIYAWMELVHHAIDGFPNLREDEYLEKLKYSMKHKEALIIRSKHTVIGAMAFCRKTGSIEFLGVHPQYRKHEIAKAFLNRLYYEMLDDMPICITTFRDGDKADTGYRDAYKKLGFVEADLLTEYGYPTQKMILVKFGEEETNHE